MLNILPPNLKKEIIIKHNYLLIKKTSIIIATIILIPTMLLGVNYFIYKKIVNQILNDYSVSSPHDQNIQDIKKNIQNFNSLMQRTTEIQNNHINPVIIINHFAKILPAGIAIENLNLLFNEKKIKLKGYASTREDLIQLQNNLSNDDLFTNFNYPISSLTEKENISFDLSGDLNLSTEIISKYAN